jgi:hypothetical protein
MWQITVALDEFSASKYWVGLIAVTPEWVMS